LFGIAAHESTGTLTRAIGVSAQIGNIGTGTITDAEGLSISFANSGGGTITTATGLSIGDVTAGSTNYAIKTGAGLDHLGGTLNLTADTGGDNLLCGNLNGSADGTCDALSIDANGHIFLGASSGIDIGTTSIGPGNVNASVLSALTGESAGDDGLFICSQTSNGCADVIFQNSAANPSFVLGVNSGAIPIIQDCGSTTTCANTQATNGMIVKGHVALSSGTPSTATVTGISPAFTSASTYVCTVSAESAATGALLSVANVSGSSFTITGPATVTTTINYICAGN
jgi:hypothetical protein